MIVEGAVPPTNRTEDDPMIVDAEHPNGITRYRRLPGGKVIGEPKLRELEQMLDEGDAHLEALPKGGWMTHRLVFHLPGELSWRVRIRETKESEQS